MKSNLSNIILSILLLCLTPITAFAENVEIDGIMYSLINKAKQATVIKKETKYSGDVVIPSTIEYEGIEYSVTSIGDNAFRGCTGLTSVTIGNSVTSIGSSAFDDCTGLTTISIGNSVMNIGSYAFFGCSCLNSIAVNANNTTYDSRENCNAIIETVSNTLILGCQNTKIPNSVTSIGKDAFAHCTILTFIDIPNGVTSIGNGAFFDCSGLTSINIPNSMTDIGQAVFKDCSGLKSVNIPNSVKSIGYEAFSSCSCLSSIDIPNSVTSIGSSAFYGCSNLTSVTIGNGISSIGSNAFANCQDLESVTIHATSAPTTKPDAFVNSYIDYATLMVPDESIDAYKSTEPWSNFGTINGISGTIVEKEKCATPTIHYADGKLTFECETEGATCNPTVTKPEVVNVSNNEMELGTIYKVSVYAAKPGYEDSDVATAEINMAQGSVGSKFDVNNDGEINITDALIIIDIILGRYY